ncbi:hypothetical protein PRBEI_2000086900 [Prionailurus iriomotensis]
MEVQFISEAASVNEREQRREGNRVTQSNTVVAYMKAK